jgi:RNA polymerase-binding transcription factor DksA
MTLVSYCKYSSHCYYENEISVALPGERIEEMTSMYPLRRNFFEDKLCEEEAELIVLLDQVCLDTEDGGRVTNLTSELQEHVSRLREAKVNLSAGKFGICLGCNQPIKVERLRANPRAVRSVDYQSVVDQIRR